jgi:hypothetical protein
MSLHPTLVLTSRYTDDAQRLWLAAIRKGWVVERLQGWRVPDHLRTAARPVLYLEALMAPRIAAELGLTLLDPAEDWLPRLPEEYRRRSIRLTTLEEARTCAEPRFIKPPNDKSFPARVYRGADLPAGYADETPVLIADVVNWESEFRCFILDRHLRTSSLYSRHGELADDGDVSAAETAGLSAFLDTFLNDPRVEVPRAAAVDVGIIEGKGWAVVECNAAWGAGLYGCDPAEVLEVLLHAVDEKIQSSTAR